MEVIRNYMKMGKAAGHAGVIPEVINKWARKEKFSSLKLLKQHGNYPKSHRDLKLSVIALTSLYEKWQ